MLSWTFTYIALATILFRAILVTCSVTNGDQVPVGQSSQSDPKDQPYGHLIIRGLPRKLELFRAYFGSLIPCDVRQAVIADPIYLCHDEDVTEAEGKFIIAQRGNCSFFKKAEIAVSNGAKGLIVLNDRGGLMRMPAALEDDVFKIDIPVVMVKKNDSSTVLTAVENDVTNLFSLDPAHEDCRFFMDSNGSRNLQHWSAEPLTAVRISNEMGDGEISFEHEGAVGEFSGLVQGLQAQLVESPSKLLCENMTKEESEEVLGHVVLVTRGQCPMVDKARRLQAAGAVAVLIGNCCKQAKHPPSMTQPGGASDDEELDILTVMIREEIAEEYHRRLQRGSDLTVRISPTTQRGDQWEILTTFLERGNKSIPTNEVLRRELLEKLIIENAKESVYGSSERDEFLEYIFAKLGIDESAADIRANVNWTNVNDLDNLQRKIPTLSETSSEDLHKVASTGLTENFPSSILAPGSVTAFNCRVEGETAMIEMQPFDPQSPFPLTKRIPQILRRQACFEKLGMEHAITVGKHLNHLREQQSQNEWERLVENFFHSFHLSKEDSLKRAAAYIKISQTLGADELEPDTLIGSVW